MTMSEPDSVSNMPGEAPPGEDTEGCACVIASYAAAAPEVSAATKDASRRIMMTPALGDFLELRFVNMGPEPTQPDDRSAAVRQITRGLLASDTGAGRQYFAIVVADASAALAQDVLAACSQSSFLGKLPMRLHGIAMREDRGLARDTVRDEQVAVAAAGAWGHDCLVGELRRYADELMRYFADNEQGLPREEFDSHRREYEEVASGEPGDEAPISAVDAAAGTAQQVMGTSRPTAGMHASSDDLSTRDSPVPAMPPSAMPPDASTAASPQSEASAAPATGRLAPAELAAAKAPPLPAVSVSPGQPGPREAETRPRRPRLRHLLDARWRHAKSPEPVAAEQVSAAPVRGLAYLLIAGEAVARDPAARQRGKAALLAVDHRMAELRQADYTVRLLEGSEEALRGESRPAGQLSKRDIRNSVPDTDFAGVLKEIRRLLRQDVARYARSEKPMARPAVVFFASDPPLADPVTAEAFARLVHEASIIWVLPQGVRRLMSSVFTDLDGTHVFGDGEGVADDIAELLVADATVAASSPREQPEAEVPRVP